MKNIDRLAKYVTKNGSDHIKIHTVPETGNWIVAEKIEDEKWILCLMNPMGNVTYNLGMVSEKEHLDLWQEITTMKIEKSSNQGKEAKEIKNRIYKFTKKHKNVYKKFIQSYATNDKRIRTTFQTSRITRKRKRSDSHSKIL